jgi:hypothetical protein
MTTHVDGVLASGLGFLLRAWANRSIGLVEENYRGISITEKETQEV